MENELMNTLQNFCDDFDLRLETSYSGRGMFGEKCIGIVGDISIGTIVKLADYLRDIEECDSAYECLGGMFAMDNMGLDKILYFPRLQEWENK